MPVITVVGALGNTVQVTVDGAQNSDLVNYAEGLSTQISSIVNTLNTRILNPTGVVPAAMAQSMTADKSDAAILSSVAGQGEYALATVAGSYALSGDVTWVTIGSNSATHPDQPLEGRVYVDARQVTARNVTVLGGATQGILFQAGGQSGTFLAGTGDNLFAGGEGNWTVATGDGNDTIRGGDGTNTLSPGLGDNRVELGSGINYVHSTGQDTITGTAGVQNITLSGTGSIVSVGENSIVVDANGGQKITVGGGSTVSGGMSDQINMAGATGTVQGGYANTISASQGNLQTVNTDSASISVLRDLTFISGTGKTDIAAGHATMFGSRGLDLQVAMTSAAAVGSDNVFAANDGNMTVDGSSSRYGIHAFGNNAGTSGSQTFIGGSGADTLVGGVGNATLTGGTGDANVFALRDGVAGADYTITDFSAVAGNSVLLVGYDYARSAFQADVLDKATHDGTSTTITLLDNSKVTFLNVASLSSDTFKGF